MSHTREMLFALMLDDRAPQIEPVSPRRCPCANVKCENPGRVGMLVYVCPVTGREQRSDIQTSPARLARLGNLKISLWCGGCSSPHVISASDITVSLIDQEERAPARSSRGRE